MVACVSETVGIFPKVNYTHAQILGDEVAEAFLGGDFDEVVVVVNTFKSAMSQLVLAKTLLPMTPPKFDPEKLSDEKFDFEMRVT